MSRENPSSPRDTYRMRAAATRTTTRARRRDPTVPLNETGSACDNSLAPLMTLRRLQASAR